jgi:hypothetical protein
LSFTGTAPGAPNEPFGPFIRVTNSFNGQRALRFDIGLLRWICANGMIIADDLVTFRFTHSKVALSQPPQFTVNRPKLSSWLDGFDAHITALRQFRLRHDAMFALVCGVLRLHPPSTPKPPEYLRLEWETIEQHLHALIARYTTEVGENAYAAFNVMTDFATRPKGRGSYAREIHTLQRRVGAWLPELCSKCRQTDFNLGDYIESLRAKPTARDAAPGRIAARTAG